MLPARKLFLIAAAAIATVALAAPTANAVEVSAEGGAHCPEVEVDNDHNVTGGCLVEAETGENTPITFASHFHLVGEVVFTICDNTFDARIHEAGDGWIYNQVITGANCGIAPCDEAEPSHANYEWPIALMEFGPSTINPTNEAIQLTFCLRPAAGDEEGSSFDTCTIFVPFEEVAPHTYQFTTLPVGPSEPNPPPAARMSSRCSQNAATSFTGQWSIHDTPLEITH